MNTERRRPMTRARTSIIAAALLALAWTTDARADGAVEIDTCQTLSSPNTTYKLIADIETTTFDCLLLAADRITVDLQGHSITAGNPPLPNNAIRNAGSRDLIVIKNGHHLRLQRRNLDS